MRPLPIILSSVVLSAVVTLGLLRSPLVPTPQAPQTQQMVLEQGVPMLKHFEIGGPGLTDGDLHVFSASFTGADGVSGTVYGQMVTVDMPDGDDLHADRLVNLTFDFGDDNTIVVAGQSKYPKDAQEMQANVGQPRPIIGGTGRYTGAAGELISQRNENGTYTHTLAYRAWPTP